MTKLDLETWKTAWFAQAREQATRRLAEAASRSRSTHKTSDRRPGLVEAPGEHLAKADRRAKLTEDDVRSIRRRHAAGENRTYLAQEFGVSCRSVNLIVTRRRWAHVTD